MRVTRRIAVYCSLQGYSARVVRGIKDYARPSKPWLIHFIAPGARGIEALRKWKPDGILASLITREDTEGVLSLGKPVANFGFFQNRPAIAHMGQDDLAIGRVAAEHLLARGFLNFAFIGDERLVFSNDRERGFYQAIQKQKQACFMYREERRDGAIQVVDWMDREDRVRRWLRELPKPVGIMACNDNWGWHVSEICLSSGLRVPDEVALIGVDNDELLCEMAFPTLTSVDTRPERIGYQAAAVLDGMMKGARAPRRKRFQPMRIITRASSDVVAVRDADVSSAVQFIRERAIEGISVSDVVENVAVSRRLLERRFKAFLGRTPLEEIHLRRIEHARNLLCDTELPVQAIARQAGFNERQRFNVIFRRLTGMTASEFRMSVKRRR